MRSARQFADLVGRRLRHFRAAARHERASRAAVALYCEESRAKMERLRSYALKHRRGFTLDVDIRAAVGEHRWVRLIALLICAGGKVVRLRGLKLVI